MRAHSKLEKTMMKNLETNKKCMSSQFAETHPTKSRLYRI